MPPKLAPSRDVGTIVPKILTLLIFVLPARNSGSSDSDASVGLQVGRSDSTERLERD